MNALSQKESAGFSRDARGQAELGGTNLLELLATGEISTPCYVYDLSGIRSTLCSIVGALRPTDVVAYAVKANSAGSVLRTVSGAGGGADVVSGGELELALACGIAPSRIVMSGVAKQSWEIDAALSAELFSIQAESVEELVRIAARGQTLGRVARVGLRINPSVEIDSHSHIATGHDAAKFGIRNAELGIAWAKIDESPWLSGVGISAHVGSNLSSTEPYLSSARAVVDVARARSASGKALEYVNFGGGFGVDYGAGRVAEPATFARQAVHLLEEAGLGAHRLVVEPGRSIVAPFGVLLASVVQTKVTSDRRWTMIDAGMNDLIRPALYAARHRIEPLSAPPSPPEFRVVGPICESSDDFGMHELGGTELDYVAIRDAGAYGFTLASEYNGRPLPAEVFLDGGKVLRVSPRGGRAAWVRRRLDA